MKIENITVTNFKALVDAEINLEGCSCIVTGDNDLGKSSLLKGLIDRFRGEIPELIVRQGETKGGYTMVLTDGSKIEWLFTAKTERFKFTTVDGVLEKTGVFSSIAKKYFGEKFDIDKFLVGTPKHQEKELQRLVGLDFTDINKRLKVQFDLRTDANRELKRLKDGPKVEPLKIDAPDVSDLEFDLEMIKDKNVILKNKWKKDNETHLAAITTFNKEQSNLAVKYNDMTDDITYLRGIHKDLKGCVDFEQAKVILSSVPMPNPDKPIVSLPEPEYNSTEDVETKIREVNANVITFANYKRDLDDYNKYVIEKNAAIKLQAELDIAVKAVEAEKSQMIKDANMPDEFSVGDEGLTYKGFALSNAQISLSAKYIAALKLGALSLGEIKAMHFDASALTNPSLIKVQKWAEENGLQLLIERPDLDGGDIQYNLISE